jgi:hypothetical protein
MHDAHEILTAFQSIGKLGSVDERLEVLHASLVLASDEQLRLCQRTVPTRRFERPSFRVCASKTSESLNDQSPTDIRISAPLPQSENVASLQTAAVYNAVPFKKSRKHTGARASHQLRTRNRGSVDRFQEYLLESGPGRVP